jgi:hypothetical protein
MNKVLNKLWVTLLAIGFVIFLPLLLPILLPIVGVLHGVYLLRLRAAAGRFRCVDCGQILDRKSIQLADAEWAERMHDLMNRFPGVRPRVVRNIHAICSMCGTRYRFDEKARSFAKTSAQQR